MNTTTNTIKELPLINEISATLLGSVATKDDAFRNQLLNDPRQAIQSLSSQSVSQDINVRVAQNTEDTVHIPVPNYDKLRSKEYLSDKELKKVSGGEILIAAVVATGLVVLSGAAIGGLVLYQEIAKQRSNS